MIVISIEVFKTGEKIPEMKDGIKSVFVFGWFAPVQLPQVIFLKANGTWSDENGSFCYPPDYWAYIPECQKIEKLF